MSVLLQGMCIFTAGPSRSSDGLAKNKEKVPNVSNSNQHVETTWKSKLKFTEYQDLFIKRVQGKYMKFTILFIQSFSSNLRQPPCVLENDFFFSTNSTMKALSFIGHNSKSNMDHYGLQNQKLKKLKANE